jgi:hypothetical protein
MNIICGSCGRWNTAPIHCHNAIITLLCIKKYTNALDKINRDIIQKIVIILEKSSTDSVWQSACTSQRWDELTK